MSESNSGSNRSVVWLYILSAITVLALVANGLNPASRHARLYFLDARGTKLVAETRDLSLVGSLEQRSQKVLQELMLGPFSYELQPLFRQDVRLVGVMHRGNKLTVELTIPDLAGLDVSFKLIRAAFEKSLAESVPGAGELDLYVNGALALR